jgi:hypothetical protein
LGAIGLAFRSELRRRWRSWLAIAVLLSVVGGVVLAAGSAGRRTSSAFPDFVARHGFDALVYAATPLLDVGRIPGVEAWSAFRSPNNGQARCACTHPINSNDLGVAVLSQGGVDPEILVAGQEPDPSNPHQVVVSFTMEKDFGLHLGSVVTVPFYARSQEAAYNSSPSPPPARGPAVAFTVVGFNASVAEFPTGGMPTYFLYATPAFERVYEPKTFNSYGYFIRLRDGVAGVPRLEARLEALRRDGVAYVLSEQDQISAVESSIHPQAVGWWVLAGLAALVGLAVVGQTMARQTLVEGEDYPTMVAIGMERRQIVVLAMVRNVAVGVAGALGALVIAVLLSPIAPLGEARDAETATGLHFDGQVLSLGAVAILLAVLVLGLGPAFAAARARPGRSPAPARASVVAGWLATAGARPSVVVGVRSALERKSGGSSVPVGSALVGMVLAVVALVGTSVFGASLNHLISTPPLYGDPFAFNLTNGGNGEAPAPDLVRALKANPAVTGVTEGYALPTIAIDKATVGAIAGTPLKGHLLLSAVSGHLPDGPRQIGLGVTTMHQVGASIGSRVKVTIALPFGPSRTVDFTVVGTVALPVLGQVVGLGTGSVFTLPGYLSAACAPGAHHAQCLQAETGNGGGLLVSVAPGAAGRAVVRHYLAALGSNAATGVVPTSLINFGEAVNFPAIFGVMLALFGAATLLHLLVVSVARRRRDVGLLKVVGFVNGQVAASVAWQATTLAVIGIAIGVPAGIAVGEVVWRAFARAIGAVPVAVVPGWAVVVVAVGVALVANVMAIGPALVATRSRPSDLLRTG